jgi:hypothetical protein
MGTGPSKSRRSTYMTRSWALRFLSGSQTRPKYIADKNLNQVYNVPRYGPTKNSQYGTTYHQKAIPEHWQPPKHVEFPGTVVKVCLETLQMCSAIATVPFRHMGI